MTDTSWKDAALPLFLLVIMVASVIGLAYSPQDNQGAAPTGSAQESFTYNGYDFEYVSQGGRTMLQANVDGRRITFQSRPQSVQRFNIPSSFTSTVMNTSQITVVAPSPQGGEFGQARYAANQLAADISRRTPLRASSVNEDDPSCTGEPRILVSTNGSDSLLSEAGPNCYETSTLDQSILIIADYIAYTVYDIL